MATIPVIKVGSKRNVTFECLDKNNQPAVGADGQPLQVVGIPSWSLGEAVSLKVPSQREASGATLVPAADGLSCDVIADAEGITLALHTYADRGDGEMVHGGSLFETAAADGGTVPQIAYLKHAWGEEVPVA